AEAGRERDGNECIARRLVVIGDIEMRDVAEQPRFEAQLDLASALRAQIAISKIAGRETRHIHVIDDDGRWAEVLDAVEGSGMDGVTTKEAVALIVPVQL